MWSKHTKTLSTHRKLYSWLCCFYFGCVPFSPNLRPILHDNVVQPYDFFIQTYESVVQTDERLMQTYECVSQTYERLVQTYKCVF